jgi:hypothetical protein
MQSQHTEVPDFRIPFPPRKHPGARQANAEAAAWALRCGLIEEEAFEEFQGIAFGHLAARVLPDAPYEHVLTLARWIAWSFVLDDQHDHLIRVGRLDAWLPVSRAVTGHLDGGGIPVACRNPMTRAFASLADQVLAGMPAGLGARYRHHIKQMMDSLDREAANRSAERLPRVTDYILMRRHSSQLPAMLDMSEAALGVETPAEIYTSPTFQELYWSATDVICWANDIFSFRKEAACGDNNNLVYLLAAQYGWSIPQVVETVARRIALRIADFRLALTRLPHALDTLEVTEPAARAAALRCARNLRDWMIGVDQWHRRDCTRYQDTLWNSGLEGAYTRTDLLTA